MIRQMAYAVGSDYQGPLRRHVTALVLSGILQGVAFALLVPVLRALLDGDTATAGRWLLLLLAAAMAAAVVNYAESLMGYRLAASLLRRLRHRLGDHVATLPLGWFTAQRVGRLGRVASQGVMDVNGVPAHLLKIVVNAVVIPATVAVLMFAFDWRLALALLAGTPLIVLAYRFAGSLIQRTDHAVEAAAAEAGGRVVEYARGQAVLRAHGRGGLGFDLLDRALRDQHRAGYQQLRTAVPGLALFALTIQLAFTLVFVVAANLALGGDADVAELIAVLVLVSRFAEPLVEAADIGGALRIARNSLARVNEVFATRPLPEPDHPATPGDLPSIELDGVRFSYGDHTVLDGVSFAVAPGTVTALVGPSGSGKTTITRLIARFWDVTAGAVRVGGVDVRELSTPDLMRQVSLVFQDVYLFEGTIEENIRLGRPGASDAEVREAARLARVDEIVDRLPDGWATQVGEGGVRLSGGERQRVSIARALLKDAPIVLLDEATAALDPENEAAIQDALAALATGRTLLVIAHRLQTVAGADQIVVLDQGRVAQTGTHDQLLRLGGRYAAFWLERSRAHGWRLVPAAALVDGEES